MDRQQPRRQRAGTVKINLALDRLPVFASHPEFDPQVHGRNVVRQVLADRRAQRWTERRDRWRGALARPSGSRVTAGPRPR